MPELMDFGGTPYLWVKTLHVVAVITWMAALFYLPRLFVYHAMTDLSTEAGRAQSETFKIMERRLQRGIMTPSLVIVLLTGFAMFPSWATAGWMHVKLTAVVLMVVCHVLYARWRQDFLRDGNTRSDKFYRVANEVPTILLLVIIPMVILKPF